MERIKLVPFHLKTPPRWKCPEGFKLGLRPPWESSDSEEESVREMDELLMMLSYCQDKQDGIVHTKEVEKRLIEAC